MSFCQKHSNHHCVHHHNCKDPSHSKKNTTHKKQPKQTSSQSHLASIQQENQQCAFSFQQKFAYNQECLSTKQKQEYLQKIRQLQIQNIKLRGQNDKTQLENRHLECQMDYLREQIQKIVSNNSTDIKVQIQKHLQQNRNLCLRIKQLALQNQELSNKVIDLQNNLDSYRIEANKFKIQRDDLLKRLKVFQEKYQKQTTKYLQLNKKYASHLDQNKQMQSKYSALSKQSQFTLQQFQTQIQRLKNQVQKLNKENLKLKGKCSKNEQLHLVDSNLWKQKQTKLIDTISKLKENLSTQQKNNKTLKQKIQELQEKYQHSKKIIMKLKEVENQREAFKQTIKLEQQLQSKTQFENKTIPKLQNQKNLQEILQKCSRLQKQNFQLKTQVNKFSQFQRPLETHNQNISIQKCQEYILKIGASQAFKKIIEQKNRIITSLIKEKGKVYEKLFQSQEKRK